MIGRDPKRMDFFFNQNLKEISRRHCCISYYDNLGWFLKDEYTISGT